MSKHKRFQHRTSQKQVIPLQPLFDEAIALHQQGQLEKAKTIYQKIISLAPQNTDALHLFGVACAQLKQFELAVEYIEKAIKLKPNGTFYNNLGNAYRDLKQFEKALENYSKAIPFEPNNPELYYHRGNVFRDLKEPEKALRDYAKSCKLEPNNIEAQHSYGITLQSLQRLEEAVACFKNVISLNPNYPEIYNSLGISLQGLGKVDEAIQSFKRAIQLKPDDVDAYANIGITFAKLKKNAEAIGYLRQALLLKPDYNFLYGNYLHLKTYLADWDGLNEELSKLETRIRNREKASFPFPVIALYDSPELHQITAETYVENTRPPVSPIHFPLPQTKEKICIGYFSADLQNHATTILMAGLFEKHNQEKFRFIAFSFGPSQEDEMRSRIRPYFEKFIDVRFKSDAEIAELSRSLGVDIAVDLKGFTTDARHSIFFHRCAPIQINYLGFPGTMGMKEIDYLIADKTLISEETRPYYTEKIIYMPHSYQVNDRNRVIADKQFTRADCGLPETGFIFCCFNNNYKILPDIFNSWMTILKRVEGSILWLFESNEVAANNFRKSAEASGVDSRRLVFAPFIFHPFHLARYRLADLFLDSLPCNAHTTASDALWAGVPVLTQMGKGFSGRVSASLLYALDLSELVVTDQKSYEEKAVFWAEHSNEFSQLKQKLWQNRLTKPLFDTALFTHHLEEAYEKIYQRYIDGLQAEDITL